MLSYIARKFAQGSFAKCIYRTIKAHGPVYDATSASIARRRWVSPLSTLSQPGSSPRAPPSLHCWCWLGAGRWSVGAGPGSGSSPQGDPPGRVHPAAWPSPDPHPGPWPLDAALWKPGLSSDPVPGPHVPALCPHCPLAQGPPWMPPVCAPCCDPSLLPEALGPLQGLPSSPRRPPPPPSVVLPTALAVGQQCRLQRAGEGALVAAVQPPPQPQDMVDGAALHPLSSGPSSGRFCSGPVAGP